MASEDDERFTSVKDVVDAMFGTQEPCPHCDGTGMKPSPWDSPEDEFAAGVRAGMERADV